MTLFYEITNELIEQEQLVKINTIISDPFLYNGIINESFNIETILKYSININDFSINYNKVFLVLPSNCKNDSIIYLLKLLENTNIEFVFYEWEPTFNLYLEIIQKYIDTDIIWFCANSLYKLDIQTIYRLNTKENNSIISLSSKNNHISIFFKIHNFNERLLQLLTISNYTNIEEINYILYLFGYNFCNNDTFKPIFVSIDDNNCPKNTISSLSNKIRFINTNIVSTKLNDSQKNNLLEFSNKSLSSYIETKINNNEHFIIPRISLGIQPQCILLAHDLLEAYKSEDTSLLEKYSEQIQNYIPTLKINSGIYCTDIDSLLQYYNSYMSSLNLAEYIIEPEVNINSEVYKTIYESINFIKKENSNKQYNFFYCLEIYNLIHKDNLWIKLFKNKKILIISSQSNLIEKQMNKKIYKEPIMDISNCSFLSIRDTRENMESSDWMIEYKQICDKLIDISNNYDIALVAANGFSNPLLEYIYSTGKSGIYIGNILDIYFGITNKNDNAKYIDIMGAYGSNEWIEY